MKRTLVEETKQNLRRLKMNDMADELDQSLTDAGKNREGHLTFIARLVKKQVDAVNSRSLERRIKKAGFPERLTFENFDWNFQPGLNIEYIKNLAQLDFIEKRQPLLILGKTGTGKEHLATAFGIQACKFGYRVAFYRAQDLLSQLYSSLAFDTTDKIISDLIRHDLLILVGLGYIRPKSEYPSLLFDLVNACRKRVSLIITSSISFEEWGQMMGNSSVTNAIVDRLFDHAALINIRSGRSYRTEGPHAPHAPNLSLDNSDSN
jgi:DNA replication protein DnaC